MPAPLFLNLEVPHLMGRPNFTQTALKQFLDWFPVFFLVITKISVLTDLKCVRVLPLISTGQIPRNKLLSGEALTLIFT